MSLVAAERYARRIWVRYMSFRERVNGRFSMLIVLMAFGCALAVSIYVRASRIATREETDANLQQIVRWNAASQDELRRMFAANSLRITKLEKYQLRTAENILAEAKAILARCPPQIAQGRAPHLGGPHER